MLRYYDSLDVKAAGFSFTLMLVVYLGTMAPTVTLEQSGAMVAAADHLGVGKHPGFPVWHLLGHLFIRTFSFVTHHGHPNPAWATNAMSAFFGAVACGFITLIVSRLSRGFFLPQDESCIRPITTASAIAAALMFGFSPTMWSQSVITESHTLTNSYAAMLLAALLHWIHTRSERYDLMIAFLFGLAFSVSQLLWLYAPVVIFAAARISWRKCAELACAILATYVSLTVFLRCRSLTMAGVFISACLLVSIVLHFLKPSRRVALQYLLMMAGLLPIAYLPIAASFKPPMNMGQAYTWEGFVHVMGRGQYERITPTNPFTDPDRLLAELSWLIDATAFQFMLPMVLFGIVPLLLGITFKTGRKELGLVVTALASFALFTAMGLDHPPTDIQTRFLVVRMYLPVFLFWSICIGCGMVVLFDLAGQRLLWSCRTVS